MQKGRICSALLLIYLILERFSANTYPLLAEKRSEEVRYGIPESLPATYLALALLVILIGYFLRDLVIVGIRIFVIVGVFRGKLFSLISREISKFKRFILGFSLSFHLVFRLCRGEIISLLLIYF